MYKKGQGSALQIGGQQIHPFQKSAANSTLVLSTPARPTKAKHSLEIIPDAWLLRCVAARMSFQEKSLIALGEILCFLCQGSRRSISAEPFTYTTSIR